MIEISSDESEEKPRGRHYYEDDEDWVLYTISTDPSTAHHVRRSYLNKIYKPAAYTDSAVIYERSLCLFIKGVDGKIVTLPSVSNLSTIEEIKIAIREKGEYYGNLRLIYAGKQLLDDRTVVEYGIRDCSTMLLVPSLRGD